MTSLAGPVPSPRLDGRLLLVCTGNVCRSPLLERALRSVFPGSDIVSAGTMALVGSPMTPQTAVRLARLGGDPAGFTSRQLTEEIVRDSDMVITATRAHRAAVIELEPRALHRTHTFGDLPGLGEGLTQAAVDGALGARGLRRLARALSERRGLGGVVDASEVDLIDPYRRDDDAYDEMADQVHGWLPRVCAVLALAGQRGGRAQPV